ncbi:glycine oxidase ThiO [Lichenibacterium dinghuense]|uniref:glycine oxidase ThiO n=1 Tax=Lichenibacterium dinghuense TaxID=2895977 RepID=UPI001F00D7A6|nr:glycine oxidase ThiO [Lichenibacterium sp. 6Y81]
MAGAPVLFNALGPLPAAPPGPAPEVPARVDVAVVGGGVIGLSVGWRLLRRGLTVAVFDAGVAGGGTSSAATGMLAAEAEHEPGGDPLLGLCLESLALWPAFRDELEADAGLSIDYWEKGTLVVAVGRDEVDRLRARHALQLRAGLDARWMGPSAVLDLEPGLRPNVSGGIFCPGDHQVDPRLTVAALRAAFVRRGGRLVEGAAVDALDLSGGRVAGITIGGRVCRADTVVIASGAAAASGGLLPAGLHLPLRPLKGQSMALRPRPRFGRNQPLPLDHVVWTAEVHIAPKSDGRMIVGATMEEAGFDPHVTAGGLYALLEGVRRVLPGVEEMAVEGVWAGFRPTTEDDAPALGACAVPGLAFAAGHHRNGYLLAPVTARAVEELVIEGAVAGAAAGFGIGRFAGRDA